jgi:hypothetical protein
MGVLYLRISEAQGPLTWATSRRDVPTFWLPAPRYSQLVFERHHDPK